jgi:hypothetical protein
MNWPSGCSARASSRSTVGPPTIVRSIRPRSFIPANIRSLPAERLTKDDTPSSDVAPGSNATISVSVPGEMLSSPGRAEKMGRRDRGEFSRPGRGRDVVRGRVRQYGTMVSAVGNPRGARVYPTPTSRLAGTGRDHSLRSRACRRPGPPTAHGRMTSAYASTRSRFLPEPAGTQQRCLVIV